MAAAAVAVAVPGILRGTSVYFWKAGPLHTVRIDYRFAGLAQALLPGEKAGFVTDVPSDQAGRRYYDALFALSPHILVLGPDAQRVVADVQDPAQIDRICAAWHLHVVARASPGVALLERD
jgi:hypothetical protein